MTRTKVAVVGVGALGQHHARIYAQLPEAELIGVADVREERAAETARQYHCRPYSDYRQLIGEVEAVSLAVPTPDHAGIGTELLERGLHVLVEKPIAQTLEEADQLIAARRTSGTVLHVGHSERFNPALLAVKPYITRPRFFEAHRLGVFVQRSLDVDVVLDLMIHDLDLILHLVGEEIVEIRAVGIPVLTPRIDIANARLEFKNGCVANVTASRVSREKIRKLRFFQSSDYVSIDFHQQDVEMYSLVKGGSGKAITPRTFEILRQEPLELEIEAFLRAVRGEPSSGAPEGCSGEEGRKALSLALWVKKTVQQAFRAEG